MTEIMPRSQPMAGSRHRSRPTPQGKMAPQDRERQTPERLQVTYVLGRVLSWTVLSHSIPNYIPSPARARKEAQFSWSVGVGYSDNSHSPVWRKGAGWGGVVGVGMARARRALILVSQSVTLS